MASQTGLVLHGPDTSRGLEVSLFYGGPSLVAVYMSPVLSVMHSLGITKVLKSVTGLLPSSCFIIKYGST